MWGTRKQKTIYRNPVPKCFILIILFSFLAVVFGCDAVFSLSPSASRSSPSSSSVSLTSGGSKTFQVSCSDSDGNLQGVEWYLDGTYKSHSSVSGSSGTGSWSKTFNSAGSYYVEAQCYDSSSAYLII